MTEYISIEEWFLREDRWNKEKPCLDMDDINTPPSGYTQSKADWIRELLTFQFLHPGEWKEIVQEYESQQTGKHSVKRLDYYITDEGEIRRHNEQDVYLLIDLGENADLALLERIGDTVIQTGIWNFERYESYCGKDRKGRQSYLEEQIKPEILALADRETQSVNIRCVGEFDESRFNGRELFIDALNDEFIII